MKNLITSMLMAVTLIASATTVTETECGQATAQNPFTYYVTTVDTGEVRIVASFNTAPNSAYRLYLDGATNGLVGYAQFVSGRKGSQGSMVIDVVAPPDAYYIDFVPLNPASGTTDVCLVITADE